MTIVQPSRFVAQLYDDHRWFDLRRLAVERRLPPLAAGAVASAFNHVADAESHLATAIRNSRCAPIAVEALTVLAMLYVRHGRTADASRVFDELLGREPRHRGLLNLRAVFGACPDRTNQTVTRHASAIVRANVTPRGVRLPLTVNGHAVSWLLDTAANIVAISESEARDIGVTPSTLCGDAADLGGGSASCRSGVLDRVTIGATELRNVPAVVVPDAQPPWRDWPPGQRGLLGVPVLIALERIAWNREGDCRIGAGSSAATHDANLAFDGAFPIVRGEVDGEALDFVLDSGNQSASQLWRRFARERPEFTRTHGRPASTRVTQVGGSREHCATALPDIALRIGGMAGVLIAPRLFRAPIGTNRQHGSLGMDLLAQAHEVAIDFRAMSLTLR
jgi:hypothetical protein